MSELGVTFAVTSEGAMSTAIPLWADRMRRDRLARGMSVRAAVQQMRLHAHPVELGPDDDSLLRMWRRWESGETKTGPDDVYQRPIAKMFGSIPDAYFGPPGGDSDGLIPLTDDQTAELIQRLRHSHIDPAAMDALHLTVDRLCTDYASRPGPIVLADAQTWLEKINALRDKRPTVTQLRDVLSMAGWLTLLISCLRYDVGDDRAAEFARQSALDIAEDVGDPSIAAWAMEIKSWMALTRGDYVATVAAAQEGLDRTSTHGVAAQLHAQAAKAWARLGNRDQAILEQDAGRELLANLPFPANPRNHFQVDPTKYDFYAMDCWRLTGADVLAAEAAETVIRTSTAADGRPISPMRLSEAQLTKAEVLARGGDFDGAIALAESALAIDRQSLPSLLLAAREVSADLLRIKPGDSRALDLEHHIQRLASHP